MRRLAAISAFLFLSLSWGSPLFAALRASSESDLQPCCRRNGKHHCAMSMAERTLSAGRDHHLSAPAEKCPCSPSMATALRRNSFAIASSQAINAEFNQPSVPLALAQSVPNPSRESHHLKRGPPSRLLL